VEFLRAARDRLRPGGVHCQWFHLYETNPATLGLVLRTYAAVFDRVAIWYGRGNDLLLLGFGADRDLDLARIRRQFDRPDVRASFARAGVDSFAALLGHELAPSGVVEAAAAPGPIHSLLNPLLGYTAARGFFSGETVRVPFSGFGLAAERGRRRSLWRRYLASLSPADVDAEYEQFAGAVCANRNPECVAAIADWQHRLPDSQRARRLLEDPAQSVFTFGGSFDRGAFDAYRDAFIRPQPGALELAEVRKAVRSYRWHYFHAAAPPRDALVDLWKRCDPDRAAPGECEAGLARARRMSETSHTESG